jgi:hypothetical protein
MGRFHGISPIKDGFAPIGCALPTFEWLLDQYLLFQFCHLSPLSCPLLNYFAIKSPIISRTSLASVVSSPDVAPAKKEERRDRFHEMPLF